MRSGRILKKEKNVNDTDFDEYGDVYTLTAMKTDTRLFISHHEGDRTTEDAIDLFIDVERKRSIHSPIPVFTSDNWDSFEEGLLNVYGFLETPAYQGIGRKPLPLLLPYPHLKYAQVCKRKEKGRVTEVVQRVVFGEPDDVLRLLGADSGGKINTAYIERFNLTIRNSLARFIRKSMNCSKNRLMHSKAIDFFQAWYNFVKPHQSLRLEINLGRKRWMQRTPAMAEGITDHMWSLKELLTFRVPIQ
ncbi:MAG: IS1 family transposase [Candidatus Methanoperedens sp.]|nr:IS1 family transposase [Candidatus Methanoperedens sp.]